MKTYKAYLHHDGGRAVIRVKATSQEAALKMIMAAEGCPARSISFPKVSRTIDKIITDVDCSRGAPMGRASFGERPADRRVYDCRVPMCSDGAYDKGGAYWGIGGGELRVSYTKDLTYISFYRVGE